MGGTCSILQASQPAAAGSGQHGGDFPAGCKHEDVHAAIRNLVPLVLPFIPNRVASAFSNGFLRRCSDAAGQGPPVPRPMEAAVLLVDVSGFTTLSEAYSRQGTDGSEEFSLFMSSFLSRMADIIGEHGGDIDCFAGDALIVLFETESLPESLPPSSPTVWPVPGNEDPFRSRDVLRSATTEGEVNDDDESCADTGTGLRHAARSALLCALALSRDLNGYKDLDSDESPALAIHGALAIGTVFAVECGGCAAQRSEAFLAGAPLAELGTALKETAASELALAPSAVRMMRTQLSKGQLRESGCVVLPLPVSKNKKKLTSTFKKTSRLTGSRSDFRSGVHCEIFRGDLDIRVVDKAMAFCSSPAAFRSSPMVPVEVVDPGGGACCSAISNMSQSHQGAHAAPAEGTTSATGGLFYSSSATDPCGRLVELSLEPLLGFVPSPVRQRLLAGLEIATLAEHRDIIVVFVVGALQFDGDLGVLIKLQKCLGRAIDLAEVEYGGFTRQITMDDKGLACIFVFGLPGLIQGGHATRAVSLAVAVSECFDMTELTITTGIAKGQCFCGPVGDPRLRCEYGIMGDTVNTAARLAGMARKLSRAVLCDAHVKHSSEAQQRGRYGRGLRMESMGSFMLKGKTSGTELFSISTNRRQSSESEEAWVTETGSELVGRHEELTVLTKLLEQPGRQSTVVIRGAMGLGKTSILDHLSSNLMSRHKERMENMVMIRVQSADQKSDFRVCHIILRSLLKMLLGVSAEEARTLCTLEASQVAKMTASQLPAFMQPFMVEIQAVHSQQINFRRTGFQMLYRDIIQHALSMRSHMILVDDCDTLDESSRVVLTSIANRRSSSIADAPGLLVLTTTDPLEQLTSNDIVRLKLQPLAHADVRRIACESMNCTSLDADLSEYIQGQAAGCPMYIMELTNWLVAQSMISISPTGMASLRTLPSDAAGSGVQALPPTLQDIVQSQLDQLPPALQTVLRSASIVGYDFTCKVLHAVLPDGLVQSEESLNKMLAALVDGHLLLYTGPTAFGTGWRFTRPIHMDLLSAAVLRKHKLRIHRRLVLCLDKLLHPDGRGPVLDSSEKSRLVQLHAMHWMELISCSTGKAAQQVTTDDIVRAAGAFQMYIEQLIHLGQIMQVLVYMEGFQQSLHRVAAIRQELIESEQTVLSEHHGILSQAALSMAEADDAYETLLKSQKRVDGRLAQLMEETSRRKSHGKISFRRLRSSRPSAKRLGRQGGDFSKRQVLDVSRQLVPFTMEILKSKAKMFSPETMQELRKKFYNAPNMESKILFGAIVVLGAYSVTQLGAIIPVAEDAWNEYEAAGCPPIIMPHGMPCAVGLATMWQMSAVYDGRLRESRPGFLLENSIPGKYQPVLVKEGYDTMAAIEYFWEPLGSKRVSRWLELADEFSIKCGKAPSKFETQNPHLDSMKRLPELSRNLRACLHTKHESTEAPAPGAVAAMKTWNSLLNSICRLIPNLSTWKTDGLAVARECVLEACAVLMPGGNLAAPVSVSQVGIVHLKNAIGGLAQMVSFWRGRYLSQNGSDFMPAAYLYFETMLRWFQWRLHLCGELKSLPAPVPPFPRPVRGWCDNMAILPPGPRAVCSGLLMAQSLSMSDDGHSEFAGACLPATIALAKLLHGAGLPRASPKLMEITDGFSDAKAMPRSTPEHVIVPMVPIFVSAGRDATLVRHVVLGTLQARQVAEAHLRAVLKRIHVNGKPLVPEQISGLRDVDNSETVWSAVELLRGIQALIN